ncbi:MAG TPA: YggS family pyridoxal phosphate-dependent enzyme [Anseongella sp.]
MSISDNLKAFKMELDPIGIQLIAISKTKPVEMIGEAYEAGQRAFGENVVQEMVEKQALLPADIQWHMVGHLQTNKVKYIAPFVHLIHSADSLKLLKEIDKQAAKHKRVIDCLLQVHIADEETKFGFHYDELIELLRHEEFGALKNIRVTGLMGIATNTENQKHVREDFYELATLFKGIQQAYFRKSPWFREISMGMTQDYKLAVEQGSTMVRIGSAIFGGR